ncbi:FAD/NAD(P)-binding domain-containing protein [Colletotrichum somersetense]|nr:FAD/NAD(P)-binding domain-containing protein [Colletotrichum somersetense]
MSTENKSFEVAIVGGGISGVILAISLIKRNVPCVIYEQASAFTEQGVGFGMTPNAVRAMQLCDAAVREAFDTVAGQPFQLNFLDGTGAIDDSIFQFSIGRPGKGSRGCHRGQFLKVLLELVPESMIRFNKQLERIEEPHGAKGKLLMVFSDGTTAGADAVIGCDGIKSHTRGIVVGHDHPSAKCCRDLRSGKAGYFWGMGKLKPPAKKHSDTEAPLASQSKAVKMLNPEQMTHGVNLVGYPVARGTMLNVVVHCTDTGNWPSETQLTLPADLEGCLEDVKKLSPRLQKLVQSLKSLDRWGQFDLGECPPPTYAKGRVCLMGDAAHATTPHQGAGAGFCIEDAAVLASLLAVDGVRSGPDIEAVFATFNAHRRERGEWLVRTSRRVGELIQLRSEHKKDFQKIESELRSYAAKIWEFDLEMHIREAVDDLNTLLKVDKLCRI